MDSMTRAEFFGMAGLTNPTEGAYTPISLGKGNKIRNGNASWIANLRHIDFRDADQLRALTPETVTATDVYVNGTLQDKYKAIVGDNTQKVYSIRSDRYKPAQNKMLVDALASASDATGIQIFGKMSEERGRMSMNAFFADPDCNVDFGEHHGAGSDPYMLGVRAYNSHTGETGFGAEIIGVRWLCSNMCAFGDVLGKVRWNHFVREENVVDLISGMIEGYMDRIPVLQDRITAMRNEIITVDDAENALWGVRLGAFRIEGIMAHLPKLNPAIPNLARDVSVYDIFNATTAYNTYANTGGSEWGKTDVSHRAQDLITSNIQDLIDKGAKIKEEYEMILAKQRNESAVA